MKRGDLAAIPASAGIHRIERVPGRDLLLVESALSVFALRESMLGAAIKRPSPIDFEQQLCIARTPEGWSISPASGAIWVLDGGQLSVGSLALPFRGLEEIDLGPVASTLRGDDAIVGVAASGDGSRLALQVATGEDPAYVLFVVRSLDRADRRSAACADMEGIAALAIAWSEAASRFVIANLDRERVATWDGAAPSATVLLDLERGEPAPPSFSAEAALVDVALRPRGESLMLSLEEQGRLRIASLPLVVDAPPLRLAPPLPPGAYFAWSWMRDEPFGACIRETKEAVSVCLVSDRGGIAEECELPSSWSVNCLAWSADESRIYVGTEHCLGVWTPALLADARSAGRGGARRGS
jgi:hypothetical protein